MIFFNPHNKQLYVSSDYKFDEGCSTPSTCNLNYDGGIFIGLCKHDTASNSIEPYPEGTSVSFPLWLATNTHETNKRRGTVISVHLAFSSSKLPSSDAAVPPYTIHLVDGSIHSVSTDFLLSIVPDQTPSPRQISYPTWLVNSQKVTYCDNGTYVKGIMEWDLDNNLWRFSQR
jgi:hypothetical protein